jgi:hypothetical protein
VDVSETAASMAELRATLEQIDRSAQELLDRSIDLVDEVAVASRAAKAATSLPWSIQRRAANRKLSPIREEIAHSGRTRFVATGPFCVSTYVSISATCPSSCVFRDNGCYAQAGASHLTMGPLDRAGRRFSGLEVSRGEAGALGALWPHGVPQDGARGGRDLRVHVGGDASCQRGARALGDAVSTLQARGLGQAWTYTHRWREIAREAWGPISVLASCESAQDVRDAGARGYAAAVTVERFADRRPIELGGVKAIACPFESRGDGPTCVRCRLCFDDERLRRGGRGIAFAIHGSQAEAAKRRLRIVRG